MCNIHIKQRTYIQKKKIVLITQEKDKLKNEQKIEMGTHQKDIQIAHKHTNRCSIPFIMR